MKKEGTNPVKYEQEKSACRQEEELTFLFLLARKAIKPSNVRASHLLERLKISCCNDIPILGVLITKHILKHIYITFRFPNLLLFACTC